MATTIPESTAAEPPDEAREPAPAAAAGSDAEPAGAPAATPRVLFGELTSASCAVLLLLILFATKWYGVAGVPDPSAARPAISTAESGWDGLSLVRWVVLATALAALGSVLLHASQRRHGTRTDTSRLITVLGTVTSLLLIYRVLIALPTGGKVIDQKLGAFLGLLAALGIAIGGYESIAEYKRRARTVAQRARRRPGLASARRGR
jgi:hypothetical protein